VLLSLRQQPYFLWMRPWQSNGRLNRENDSNDDELWNFGIP
jgi:hypothetical protein